MAFGGFLGQTVQKAGNAISDLGSQIDDTVNDSIPGGWTTVALLAAGAYYAPEIGAWVSSAGTPVAGATAAEVAAADAGAGATTSAVTGGTAGAASGVPITTAATGAATVPGVLGTSYTAAQLAQAAKLGVTAASLFGAANAVSNMSNSGGGGLLTQQDRSGVSSGSADYGPAYYQQIQNKYNEYMPQAKGADITSDLKNWYETKYTPNVTGAAVTPGTGTGYNSNNLPIEGGLFSKTAKPTTDQIANAYSQYSTQAGGDTLATQQAAIQFLRSKGISDADALAGYTKYRNDLLAARPQPGTQPYVNQLIKEAAAQAGGTLSYNDAWNAAQKLGITQDQLNSAMTSTGLITPNAPTGMFSSPVTASSAAATPAAISPDQVANAYSQYVAQAGGDTPEAQQAAIKFLQDQGVDNNTIMAGYNLFKGA
jgi:hypothetical protein